MTFPAQLLADSGSDFGHMDWGGGGWWMMLFWGPVLLIGLAALMVWVVRSTQGAGPGAGSGTAGTGGDPLESARKILAERYARGELDSEEYEERLQRLS